MISTELHCSMKKMPYCVTNYPKVVIFFHNCKRLKNALALADIGCYCVRYQAET